MQVLRASTATVVRVGPFMATDGVTPVTSITLGAADQAELLKDGGVGTVDISTAAWAPVVNSDGWYDLSLTAGHTDTTGTLEIVVQDASASLPVFRSFQVVTQAAYDYLYGASAAPITDADVLDQVNAAIDTAIAELGVGQPEATPTLRSGLMLLYMMARNQLRTQTSGVDAIEVYNDAGVLIASKPVSDDGADYTESKMVSG